MRRALVQYCRALEGLSIALVAPRQVLEELLDSEHLPEEVCRDCPELLP
jgi:eukaryotic-like serine/threonine-protein kinase